PALSVVSFGLAVALGAVLGVIQIFVRPKPGNEQHPEHREQTGGVGDQTSEEEEEYVPESIGSLLKCGLGYILCIDVIGLFVPKLYEAWFNENPFVPEEDLEDFEAEFTMIPFGPYLALGA